MQWMHSRLENRAMNRSTVVCLLALLGCSPAWAFRTGLVGADGENLFERAFTEDYETANTLLEVNGQLQPMLDLLRKYTRRSERAEIELAIGLAHNQRTGLVDPVRAVEHLTRALELRLPERVSIDILMWRGNSYEQS